MELSKHEHKKKVKLLKETIMIKDLEISLAIEKEKNDGLSIGYGRRKYVK